MTNEELFDEFLDLIELDLVKYSDNSWALVDRQGVNLGNIEEERFANSEEILNRLESYELDFIINDIYECLDEAGIECGDESSWADLLQYRDKLPQNKFEFDLVDIICNHPNSIDLNKCSFEFAEDRNPIMCAHNVLKWIKDGKYDNSYIPVAMDYLEQAMDKYLN